MNISYRPGGLMRCCTLTLSMLYQVAEEEGLAGDLELALNVTEGAKLPCRYCSTTMVFRDGAWEWDKSAKSKYGDVPVPAEAELA